MTTPAQRPAVEELLAVFASDAANGNARLALTTLIGALHQPLREAGVWFRAGDALLRSGHAEPAAALLAAGLTQHRGNAELHYLRGNALRVSGHRQLAEAELRAALAAQPALRDAALSLAFMLREQGRCEAAASVVLAFAPHETAADRTLALIEFLRESGTLAPARTLATAARARWPDDARIAAAAGDLALAFGDFAAAREHLLRALDLDRRQTSPWLRLSYCQRYSTIDHADAERFGRVWRDAQAPVATRICAGFALGKLYDDADDCRAAAALLREANALARAESPWRAGEWQALIDRQLARAPLPRLAVDAQFVPVFIVGLPRTGTTLVATRLGRYAAVRDRGELNWIAGMFDHVAAQDALGDADALMTVAALVRTQMRRDDAPARCYLDKNPLNFRYLNLIAALFPNARIIHCRRGARDTALSLWSQHFAHPDLAFAYDFAAIARVRQCEHSLMAHWRATLPLAVHEVDYEALVGDADAQIAAVTAFLDLPAQADAAPGDQVITTASVWQARQPVYARAVDRWRRYEEFLPELVELFV